MSLVCECEKKKSTPSQARIMNSSELFDRIVSVVNGCPEMYSFMYVSPRARVTARTPRVSRSQRDVVPLTREFKMSPPAAAIRLPSASSVPL